MRSAQGATGLAACIALSLGAAGALTVWPGAATAGEGATAPAVEGPRLVLDTKELDFGEVILGTRVELRTGIENRGDAPLRIVQVVPTCGCTVASYPRELAPGERGEVAVVFDSSQRPAGYQAFRIAIYSNDPTQNDMGRNCTVLAIRGEVRSLFRLAPNGAFFGEFIRGVGAERRAVVVTGQGEARGELELELVSELPDYLEVAVEPLPATDRRTGVRIEVTLHPHVAQGEVDHALLFRTNVAKQPQLGLLVTGLVNERIMGPGAVLFGTVARAVGAERLHPIERRDGQDGIPVAAVRFDPALLSVSRDELGPQRTEVTFRVVPGARPGPFATVVEFLLDDPDQPLISVPVYGRIAPVVRLDPPLVLLPAAAAAGDRLGTILVRPGPDARVLDVEVRPDLPLRATVTPRGAGDGADLRLEATGPLPSPFPADARLIVRTTVPGEEAVEVPLVGR